MTLAAIKADLPNTPDEVIDIWLLPLSQRPGSEWPPTVDNAWRYIIGLGRDLKFLKNLVWRKEVIKITPENLTPKSLQTIESVYYAHNIGKTHLNAPNGLERVHSVESYLKKHGMFPRPVILESTQEGYTVLDGNHRMAAYFYLYGYFKTDNKEIPNLKVCDMQPAWIGEIKSK